VIARWVRSADLTANPDRNNSRRRLLEGILPFRPEQDHAMITALTENCEIEPLYRGSRRFCCWSWRSHS